MSTYRYFFRDDYSEGCHPRILAALQETYLSQQIGYGNDAYSAEAKSLIGDLLPGHDADIHFVSGGTQANLIMISAALRSYESVVSAQTGHINGHEGGAIEAGGHRVEAIDTPDGKLSVELLTPLLAQSGVVGSTQPKMVYISNTTELGTLYTKAELKALSDFCREQGWYLYLDGARLPAALMAEGNDLTLADVAEWTDAFYIGGTKNGALLGEAIVITHPELKTGFKHYLKQQGALLAKGRVLGLQFRELFRDNLIFELAAHANATALGMVSVFEQLGYAFLVPPQSNQLFPILPKGIVKELEKDYLFHQWKQLDGELAVIRLVTSWATPATICTQFMGDLTQLTADRTYRR